MQALDVGKTILTPNTPVFPDIIKNIWQISFKLSIVLLLDLCKESLQGKITFRSEYRFLSLCWNFLNAFSSRSFTHSQNDEIGFFPNKNPFVC